MWDKKKNLKWQFNVTELIILNVLEWEWVFDTITFWPFWKMRVAKMCVNKYVHITLCYLRGHSTYKQKGHKLDKKTFNRKVKKSNSIKNSTPPPHCLRIGPVWLGKKGSIQTQTNEEIKVRRIDQSTTMVRVLFCLPIKPFWHC